MNLTEKYVLYKSMRWVGACELSRRPEYCKTNKIYPIVYSIQEFSEQYTKELFDLFENNQKKFIRTINKLINEDLLAVFSN